jgi:hypothetical protein
MTHPRACLSCGIELHGIDANGHYCGKPRCAEAAASLSPTGNRMVAEAAERERIVAAVDREYIANDAIADMDEAQKISNQRKNQEEYDN